MRGKTIGIITLQNSNNYGAMYQVFALSKYLKKSGNSVFVLDYEMTRDNSSLIEHLKQPFAFSQKLFYKKELVLKTFFGKQLPYSMVERKNKFAGIFERFRDENLTITKTEYNYQTLQSDLPAADVFICGSDQIWAADFIFTSPAFLLGFVPESAKKISYAASFGKNNLEPYLRNIFKDNVNRFDAVSVREKSGVAIVDSLTDKKAVHVLDPTLLLDKEDYSEIIDYSLVPDEPFIFVYKLDKDKQLSDWMDSCINAIRENEGLTVLAVSTNLSHPFDDSWEELLPTPGQMLGLIEKSSLTITNSFHGTVFSMILQTRFLSFARDIYKDKQNVRMEEMLSNLGLHDFYCGPFLSEKEVVSKLSKPYEIEKVSEKLNQMRTVSKEFLDKAIQ